MERHRNSKSYKGSPPRKPTPELELNPYLPRFNLALTLSVPLNRVIHGEDTLA